MNPSSPSCSSSSRLRGIEHVVAIKQILYRTAKNSRIITALIKAAEAGKHVTVLVELKARFDEARNLERAEELLAAGAQIIYGVRGLKTHAKICLVMRREQGRMVRYCHFGTGNYNEATAKLYTDISYLTCRPSYGADASAFFNTVTGRSRFVHFQRISMAPFGLRERLIEMIASETERARQGDTAEIMLKMNALEDPQMIDALYDASQAGREDPAQHPRHLLPAARREGPQRQHPRHQHHRPLPRACAHLLVPPGRQPRGLHRQRRLHDAQP